MELTISSEVYEDLNKEKNSDRFEHIAPNFSFSKIFKTNLSGTLSMINTDIINYLRQIEMKKL